MFSLCMFYQMFSTRCFLFVCSTRDVFLYQKTSTRCFLFVCSTKHTKNNIQILPKLFQETEEERMLSKAFHDGTNPDTTTSESASHSAMSSSFDPTDYTVHGILQARILVWVAFLFSRGSSQPRDQTQVSCIAGRFVTS